MYNISKIGGARIGFMNATFPFAKLRVNAKGLFLDVVFIGKYRFSFNSIIKIEKAGIIPFLGWGIRIYHKREDYPSKIIFWCFGNPHNLKREIDAIANFEVDENKTAFEAQNENQEVEKYRKKDKFPIKIKYVILVIFVWNVLFLLDFSSSNSFLSNFPGPYSFAALLFVFLFSLLLKNSDKVKNEVLADVNSFKKIESFVNLLLVITGIMSIIFLIIFTRI